MNWDGLIMWKTCHFTKLSDIWKFVTAGWLPYT